mmetsp:Transcript_25143/g.72713  ORF Transcript_25143/g.72713 Transcript_25143/m.72713 type:complete len:455 (-) Transcript_25143:414-1778(-)
MMPRFLRRFMLKPPQGSVSSSTSPSLSGFQSAGWGMFCRTMSDVSASMFLICSEVSSVLSLSMMILRLLRLLRRSAVLLSLFFPVFFLVEPASSSSLSSPPIPTERLPPSRVPSRLSRRLESRPARGMDEASSPSRSKPPIMLSSSSGMGKSPSDISSRSLSGRGVRLSDPATEALRSVERRSEATESSAPLTSSMSETELLRPLPPASSSKTWRSSSSSSSSMRLASGSKAPHPSSSSSTWVPGRRRSDPWWSIPLRSESRVRSAAAAAEVWVPSAPPSWVCVRSMARRAASPPAAAAAWESSAPPSSSSSSARTQPPAAPPWPPAPVASREKGTRKARPPGAPGTPETGTPRAERSTSSVSSSMLTGWMSRPPMGPAAAASSNSPKLAMLRPAPPLDFLRPPAVGSRSTRATWTSSPSSPSAPPPCAPGRKAILILTMASWASCMRYLTLRE